MTNSPTDPANPHSSVQHIVLDGTTQVKLTGVPSLLQVALSLIGTAILIISTLGGVGAVFLNKSLEAMESKINENLNKQLSPVTQKQAEFKMIVSLLVSKNKDLTADEKKSFNDLLSKIRYEDIKGLLETRDEHKDKKSLDSLIRDKKVEQVRKITGLTWDGNHPAQVRYIRKTDPALDLSNVEFYSEGPDPCRSRLLELYGTDNGTVQVCEAHLDSSRTLELVVVTQSTSGL